MTGSDTRRDARTTWRLGGLELPVRASEGELRAAAREALGVPVDALRGFRTVRRSLDARRRGGVPRPRYVYRVDVVLDAGFRSARLSRAEKSGRVRRAPEVEGLAPTDVHASLGAGTSRAAHVAVVGAGPAGLFAAWSLALGGVRVTLLDRGGALSERGRSLARFYRTRVPDADSNLLYGEGGAGTYSDGKLYTRVDDPLEVPILEVLIACGAQPEIAFDARAHIGTDRLHRILPVLRGRLLEMGVGFAWATRLERLVVEERSSGRTVRALATSAGEVACDAVVLAPGHSARDTFAALVEGGMQLEPKAFQLGLRIEHPQDVVDRACHGTGPDAESLGPAYYNLVSRAGEGLGGAHSFCMCPGGRIVASVSEPGFLCTNGMSNSRHSSRWATAALVATVGPDDFGAGVFDGIRYQRELEARAYAAGGGDYAAPAQRVEDFLAGCASVSLPASSYRFGVRPARLDELLPRDLARTLCRAIERFDGVIPGYAGADGLLVGVESRSSSPVRAPRDRATRLAAGFSNLYPAGEGAGWAGGIMSAAIDGARSARALLAVGRAR